MNMASTLRRAPRSAATRGLLAALSGRVRHTHHHRVASVSPFSSVSAPQPSAAADAQLIRVINFEISYAQNDCRKRDWAKELGGSFPFEIQDKEGTDRITLTRSHQNEQIEVEVLLPRPANGDAQNGEQEHQSHAGSGTPTYCVPLLVRIRKGAASCLEISCSSYPTQLVIESLEFGSSKSGASLSGGTAFSDMPEELQKALLPYLRSRGISTDITDFYMRT